MIFLAVRDRETLVQPALNLSLNPQNLLVLAHVVSLLFDLLCYRFGAHHNHQLGEANPDAQRFFHYHGVGGGRFGFDHRAYYWSGPVAGGARHRRVRVYSLIYKMFRRQGRAFKDAAAGERVLR